MHARRSITLALLVGLCLTATAAASLDAGSSLRFGFVPKKAFQGQPASLTVVVRPTGTRCTPLLRYADGSTQRLRTTAARAGRAAWTWTVPGKTRLGAASVNVSCGKAGRVKRSFAVVGPPTAPAQVNVRKSGFSQRVRFTGRDVSYGVVLHNPSPENDALNVVALVNFVDATNRVVDTDSTTIPAVSAGSEYYLGGSTSIPDATQVSSLEIVIRIGSQAPKRKLSPAISDVLVQQNRYDPGWVGAVVGQIENDSKTMLLSSTRISAVVFDSSGNVVGGAQGRTSAGQLPGVRAYFNAGSDVSSIPFDQAASAGVSVLGKYEATG